MWSSCIIHIINSNVQSMTCDSFENICLVLRIKTVVKTLSLKLNSGAKIDTFQDYKACADVIEFKSHVHTLNLIAHTHTQKERKNWYIAFMIDFHYAKINVTWMNFRLNLNKKKKKRGKKQTISRKISWTWRPAGLILSVLLNLAAEKTRVWKNIYVRIV